ncbi:amino acid permease [Rhodanobacter lindaniclasticus]
MLSFLVAGIGSACAALSYAEFAGMIPVTGSVYTYGYAVLGELPAWIIGWDLLVEYALIVGVVAAGTSNYLQSLIAQLTGLHLPVFLQGAALRRAVRGKAASGGEPDRDAGGAGRGRVAGGAHRGRRALQHRGGGAEGARGDRGGGGGRVLREQATGPRSSRR